MFDICQVVVYRVSDQDFAFEQGGDLWLDLFEYRSRSEVVGKDTMDWRSASSIQTSSSQHCEESGEYSRRKSGGARKLKERRRGVKGVSRLVRWERAY